MKKNSLMENYIKNISILLITVIVMFCISGCGGKKEIHTVEIVEEKLQQEEVKAEVEEDEPEEEVSYAHGELPELSVEEDVEIKDMAEEVVIDSEDKPVVDFIIFMGQSNMSGAGGDASMAPFVPEGQGFEFRAVSDPTTLYPITEPFGLNESFVGAICDFPGAKNGSLVSSFIKTYYKETGIPVVAVSASEGATTTEQWLSDYYQADLINRYTKAISWLDANGYTIRKRYAIWLQGESDALNNVSGKEYGDNMADIMRNLFLGGLNKVFVITPGRTLTISSFFDKIINSQIEVCKESDYFALATTVLSGVKTSHMIDEWHYDQPVLNLVGEEAAKAVAFYANNQKEMCIYDYKHKETYIPDNNGYDGTEIVEPLDLSNIDNLLEFKPDNEEKAE